MRRGVAREWRAACARWCHNRGFARPAQGVRAPVPDGVRGDTGCADHLEAVWKVAAAGTGRRRHEYAAGRKRDRLLMDTLLQLREGRAGVGVRAYTTCLRLWGTVRGEVMCRDVLDLMKRDGIEPTPYTRTVMADLYARLGRQDKVKKWTSPEMHPREHFRLLLKAEAHAALPHQSNAFRLFNRIPQAARDQVDYLHLVLCCISTASARRALEEMDTVDRLGPPNLKHYNALLKVCRKKGDVDAAGDAMRAMEAQGLEPDNVTYHVLMGVYAEKGRLRAVDWVVGEIARPNADTYVAYLNALARVLVRQGADRRLRAGAQVVRRAELSFQKAKGEGHDSYHVWQGLMGVYAASEAHAAEARRLAEAYRAAAASGHLPARPPEGFMERLRGAVKAPKDQPRTLPPPLAHLAEQLDDNVDGRGSRDVYYPRYVPRMERVPDTPAPSQTAGNDGGGAAAATPP